VETRFYCENCGNDVPFNAKVCPSCGKVFSAVKCPVCLFEGKPGVFLQGCPECGYMSPQIEGLSLQAGRHSDARSYKHSEAASANKKVRRSRKKPNREKSTLLPRWLYSGGIILLLVILLILLIALFRTW